MSNATTVIATAAESTQRSSERNKKNVNNFIAAVRIHPGKDEINNFLLCMATQGGDLGNLINMDLSQIDEIINQLQSIRSVLALVKTIKDTGDIDLSGMLQYFLGDELAKLSNIKGLIMTEIGRTILAPAIDSMQSSSVLKCAGFMNRIMGEVTTAIEGIVGNYLNALTNGQKLDEMIFRRVNEWLKGVVKKDKIDKIITIIDGVIDFLTKIRRVVSISKREILQKTIDKIVDSVYTKTSKRANSYNNYYNNRQKYA